MQRLVMLAAALMGVPSNGRGDLQEVAPMRVARFAHTETTLADGRVLVAGGFTSAAPSANAAELFDPARGTFGALPSMRMPRHSHTATRLADGRVLISGGYGPGGEVLASSELYDPRMQSFTRTGDLHVARGGHVAALLPDGTVLIAGGVGTGWSFLASAERYDPRTGTFRETGAMTVPRESHVAVALLDGRVLIVGGHAGRRDAMELYASTEIYDPARSTFVASAAMHVARHKHDAVRLADGRVLVVAGADKRDDKGQYNSTEVFDPTRERFTNGPTLQLSRYKHQGTSLLLTDGRVLLAGGAPRAEVLDIATGRSALVPGHSELAGQFGAAALMRDGSTLVTGGYGNGGAARATAWRIRL